MNIQDILNEHQVPNIWWSKSGLPGIIKTTGDDIIDLIHRLSTNNCMNVTQHVGKQTILTNEKGRIIDIITILKRKEDYLMLTSSNNELQVIQWLKKFIIMEQIRFEIVTDEYEMITVHGAQSLDCISQLLNTHDLDIPIHSMIASMDFPSRIAIRLMPIHELQFLVIDVKDTGLLNLFESSGIALFGESQFERERILSGMGKYGHELSESYNPLEAGLLHLIDFKKGCYIGQEVIARLDSYNKVQKRLMGFISQYPIVQDSIISNDAKEIGNVTSALQSTEYTIGLAFIRSEQAFPDSVVYATSEGISQLCTLLNLPMRS
ncbi:MAG: YgfZ/GcvT domain-containing protein [Ignavibacteria bacterium]